MPWGSARGSFSCPEQDPLTVQLLRETPAPLPRCLRAVATLIGFHFVQAMPPCLEECLTHSRYSVKFQNDGVGYRRAGSGGHVYFGSRQGMGTRSDSPGG